MKKGYIQVYTGDGKGKTTAALGLLFRAAGRGFDVKMIQFLKGQDTGELYSIKKFSNVEIERVAGSKKFFYNLSDEEKELMKQEAKKGIQIIERWLQSDVDVLIMDEILGAITNGIVTREEIETILNDRPEGTELILTGRNAPDWLIDRADLVTEMKMIKHYMDKGVMARKGIEN